MNFSKSIKKPIEINWNRLESFPLNKIKKKIDDELGEDEKYNKKMILKIKIEKK